MALNRSVQTVAPALFLALLVASCGEPNRSGDGAGPAAAQAAPAAVGDDLAARRPPAATAWVIFGADTVMAEVARTDEERGQGLMYRESLDPDAGMLFIFPEQSVRSFWMQNTYISLDIAFMDRDFRVVDIQQMEAMTTDSHVSRAPAMYALETNMGWFEAHGVQVGDRPEVVFGR